MTPPGEITRPLVPNVAYLAYATLPRAAAPELIQLPKLAPTVAVEILSPDDRPRDTADKIETYLLSGTFGVFIVDPELGTIDVHSKAGQQRFGAGDVLTNAALPGFALDVTALFERARN